MTPGFLRRLRRDQSGQALAEFAIILPLLLLLIAGILEFGRGWNVQQAVTDASREAARQAVLANGDIQDSVKARIKRRLAAAGLDSSQVTITFTGNWKASGDPMTAAVSTPFQMQIGRASCR